MDLDLRNQPTMLIDIRQRLINVENKINALLLRVPAPNEFRGSQHQRFGHISYSQHGEDMVFVALFERFGIARPTYLDIGANHPTDCSNTALLYSRGARGVNIDASPDVIRLFEHARPEDLNVNVGVAGRSGTMTFYRLGDTAGTNSFSREAIERQLAENPAAAIADTIEVPVLTLNQVIRTYCGGIFPDLLSVDAEGLDYEILEAASFASRPKILCVETLSPAGENEAAIDALLIRHGFRKCIQMHANGIYIGADVHL
jgi:FkbM family methyltransferase